VTPLANCPSFSSVIRVMFTRPAGDGAEGMSVGGKLRLGAYADCEVSAETRDMGNVTVRRENVNNNAKNVTFSLRLSTILPTRIDPRHRSLKGLGDSDSPKHVRSFPETVIIAGGRTSSFLMRRAGL